MDLQALLKETEDWSGFTDIRGQARGPGYEQRLRETIDLLTNAKGLPSYRHEYLIREALTTSDFPLLFGDVLDRQVLAQYKAVDPVWKAFTKQSTVNRIFPQVGGNRYAISGGDQLLDEVAEKGEYLASTRAELRYQLTVRKYGRQFDISWESLINDDLGALKDTPERFSRAATRTEHRLLTATYADDDGTHGAGNLYDKTTANEVNGSVALLTIANLQAGLGAMAGWLDEGGEPIMNRAKFLVVPPLLEMTAKEILQSPVKQWVELGGAGGPLPFPTTNVVATMGLQLIVDPYLPVVDATNGDTAWYLFSDPADIAALEVGHLTGHETPEIVMKASNKVAIGGAPIGPLGGDFATDNVFYRVRIVFGTLKLDWRATFAGGLVS